MATAADDKLFTELMDKAREAANAAGDKWFAEHTKPIYNVMNGSQVVGQLLDVCGMAFLELTDKRTKFAKWYKKKYQSGYFTLDHKYSRRQEMGLSEACMLAALQVFEDAGIKGLRFRSFID